MKNELKEVFEGEFKLEESKNKNVLATFITPFFLADKKTSNGTIYKEKMMMAELKRYNGELEKSGISGQLNHPSIPATELDKISHVITKVDYDQKSKFGFAEMAILNTTKGRDLKVLIDSSVKLGCSMRGYGTKDEQGFVRDDYKLRTIDIVENPSYGSDTLITKAMFESGNEILETMTLSEAFFSLRNGLEAAVRETAGKKSYIVDFSDAEVIYRVYSDGGEVDTEGEEIYYKADYKINDDEEIELGATKKVERKVEYESIRKQYEDAVLSGFTGSRSEFRKLHEEELIIGDLKEGDHAEAVNEIKAAGEDILRRRFEEAVYSNFTGSFSDFKKLTRK